MFVLFAFVIVLFFLVVDIYAVHVVDKEMSANLRATSVKN